MWKIIDDADGDEQSHLSSPFRNQICQSNIFQRGLFSTASATLQLYLKCVSVENKSVHIGQVSIVIQHVPNNSRPV